MEVSNKKGNSYAESEPDWNLEESGNNVITRRKTHPYMKVHKRHEAATNCVQDHDNVGHAAHAHQVSKKTCNGKKAEDSHVEWPQSSEWNQFVILEFWRVTLASGFSKEGKHKHARYQRAENFVIRCKRP